MAGIYIHIPFCKQACHYCNFHFSTSLKYKDKMVEAILKEIVLRKDYLHEQRIHTIYFGGGTPSMLDKSDLYKILNLLYKYFRIDHVTETTLEANPDDITIRKLIDFKELKINRLSIGIQSFHDADLKYMNRAHDAAEAQNCIAMAKYNGFDNISIDLIYGSPTTSDDMWMYNVQKAIELDIPHISSYGLTVEKGTALYHFIEKGKSKPLDDEQSERQYYYLIEHLAKNDFHHYEISNFAREGCYALHNTNYWKGIPYLGLGPSAHSFNGKSRQWNIPHNSKYMLGIEGNKPDFELEILTPNDHYNEYVMTSLRTMWGCSEGKINEFSNNQRAHFEKIIGPYVKKGYVLVENGVYRLSFSGKMIADRIASDLFFTD